MLKGKKILLGVSGSIAAYKSAFLVRLFIKAGAKVKVILTPSAHDFVTPVTLSTLSKNLVYSDFVKSENTGEWNNHVELGLWADLMIIAPATANTLAKMSNGICDNLLIATYLSAKCSVYFAPAMDLDMYKHGSTKASIETLLSFGNHLIKPGVGELASGLSGEGRMAEPEEIVDFITEKLSQNLPLKEKKVLITAGPTYEPIDPVRFIGNHSTGKMGFALAEAASSLGAEVKLVSGPSRENCNNSINRIDVMSAQEMFEEAISQLDEADIIVCSAAVADYKPATQADQKIKKKTGMLSVDLVPTQDILAHIGKHKKEEQILVGFALETNNEVENAKKKLKKKNLDLIVLNSLQDKGAGFGHDTNKVTLISRSNKMVNFELKPKQSVAYDIMNAIVELS